MKRNLVKRFSAAALLAVLTLGVSTSVFAKTSDDSIHINVTIDEYRLDYISDVVYSQIITQGQVTPLKMDLIVPRSAEKLPLVVFVKGGGFSRLNKDQFLQQRMAVAEKGYVVATVEHRLVPTYTFPTSVIDVKASIRYLKAHADEFNIDKEKVAIWGDSSGGYMAAMIGTTNGVEEFDKGEYLEESSDVVCAVDMYGPSDLTRIGEGLGTEVEKSHYSASTTEAMLVNGIAFGANPGGSVFSNPEKANYANPLSYVDPSDPPFLIMHGTSDSLVSPVATEILHEKLKENGVESTRYLIDGGGHADDYFFQNEITDLIVEFLDEKLK